MKNSIQMKLEQSGEYDRCALATARPPRSCNFSHRRPTHRLKEHLRQKLIDCGWRDNLKEHTMGVQPREPHRTAPRTPRSHVRLRPRSAAELIRSKGDTTMTVEQLTQEIIPRGRGVPRPSSPPPSLPPFLLLPTLAPPARMPMAGTVPDDIKAELLQRIRRFAEQQS